MRGFHPIPNISRPVVFATFSALILTIAPVQAQTALPPCASDSAYAVLDFWVGQWEVFVGDQKVGENRIEKILNGCAITEEWIDSRGSRGHSLFYLLPATGRWRQVWVTDQAMRRGGVKEKEMIAHLPNGVVRFQGTIALPGGENYLDRTTLTPVAPGEVRQVIQISTDQGESWQTTFDARYLSRP
jgi:hypothetical protein